MALGSRFTRYWNPVLSALKELGGSARPREVCDWVAANLNISDIERLIQNQNGGSRFENDVAWARFYLARNGYIESSQRGVWSLTEQGLRADPLTEETISKLLQANRKFSKSLDLSRSGADVPERQDQIEQEVNEQVEQPAPEDASQGHREQILQILRTLPPQGFERLCQLLLRESGFQQVRVTGRSGDGGIDGIGILQVNTFVSFKVVFQCKRWSKPVGSPEIRNFRGAMMGRADKGLILTTDVFTSDAQAEAVRDGALPVELVDGQALVTLLEKLELGLKPIRTYEVNENFFDEFSH